MTNLSGDQITMSKNTSNELVAVFSKIFLEKIDHQLDEYFEKEKQYLPVTWCDDDFV
ncbi:MAG: hypothetical protein IPL46_04500 [Saprospiraceae bacterium]|nr:hypothetical protein [Saprospiraceae bacterium]